MQGGPRVALPWYVALLAMLAAPVALAGDAAPSLAIAPGQWEFELSTMMAMSSEPQVNSRSQCIAQDRLDPASFLLGKEGSGCQISEVSVDGQTMRWTQACASSKGGSKARAEATVKGDTAMGKMEMTILIGAHPIPVVTAWTGKRVGECSPTDE